MADVRLASSTQNGDGRIKIQPMAHDATWVATLSNGETAVEESGKWTINPGEPLPWVRLCYFLADNDLHLTSLRLNIKGRTIHLPRANFDKFELNSKTPNYYSLSYKMEVTMDMSGGPVEQQVFVDLAAHYDQFAVHYIQNATIGNESWVVITDNQAISTTPRNNNVN